MIQEDFAQCGDRRFSQGEQTGDGGEPQAGIGFLALLLGANYLDYSILSAILPSVTKIACWPGRTMSWAPYLI